LSTSIFFLSIEYCIIPIQIIKTIFINKNDSKDPFGKRANLYKLTKDVMSCKDVNNFAICPTGLYVEEYIEEVNEAEYITASLKLAIPV
jgi:hypothetical protein